MQASIAITLVITIKDICQYDTFRCVFIAGLQYSPKIKNNCYGQGPEHVQFRQDIFLSQSISDICFYLLFRHNQSPIGQFQTVTVVKKMFNGNLFLDLPLYFQTPVIT
ncbi:hypothetical protein BvCmsKSP026_00546 [Escherichia coli]|nr:hypothetical protein BvCmsKKP062_04394 [Escherichia coli]GDJ56913.1 hypothetical protein BvCmsKSP009_04244 [Escherichia coli]GDJ98182.1 hypothetical protein BvCmsKSP026_00546 [Escherichia coli]GDK59312.1 hypothetical protein BvCmsKSP001_01398 [Escherichia coli]GDL21198.1 hypothetical protein BvCmsKSP002_04391 [Escherichia coli]